MDNQKNSKVETPNIPMPPVRDELYYPISFWSEILTHLDRKAQAIAFNYGWGKINLGIIIQEGKIAQVVFNDEVRVRGLEKAANEVDVGKWKQNQTQEKTIQPEPK